MFIQWCVKGISDEKMDWAVAKNIISKQDGIQSNWLRQRKIDPKEIAHVLTPQNLDRHLHDYGNFGSRTPFISLSAGSVSRDTKHQKNDTYSAIDTALAFATDNMTRSGFLFFCWVPVALNQAVEVGAFAEEVRELHTYRRWSPFQLEGEITAKIHVPSNQIQRVEWWDKQLNSDYTCTQFINKLFVHPAALMNVRDLF